MIGSTAVDVEGSPDRDCIEVTLAKLKAQVQKLKKKKDELNPLPEVVAFPSGPDPSQPKSADAAFTMSSSTPTGIDLVITKKRRGHPPKAVVARIQNGTVADPVPNQSGVEDPNQLLGSEEATAVKSLANQNLTPVHDPVKPQKRRGRPRKALVGDYATTVHHSTPDISANISPSQPYQSCSVRKAISTKNPPTILDPIKLKKRRGRPKGSRNKTLAEKGYKKDGPKERHTILPLNLYWTPSTQPHSMAYLCPKEDAYCLIM
uniref:Uncharacterized protein n=1 Tax=Chenopodium quinoa TaxID=63459 RepID=A0A803L5B7_CHEQI